MNAATTDSMAMPSKRHRRTIVATAVAAAEAIALTAAVTGTGHETTFGSTWS